MKKLLLITADYYPYPSSNTNCLEPLISGLEEDGWQIDLITRKMRKDSPYFEENASRRVWRIEDARTIHTIYINEQLVGMRNGPSKRIKSILGYLSKGLYYIRYCLCSREPRFAGWNRKAVLRKCKGLLQAEPYSAIMSVSYPVVTHVLAMQLKKTTDLPIPWILLEFDPYCFNKSLYGQGSLKRLERHQHILYQNCDAILTTPELYDFYQSTPFHIYAGKMESIPLANLKRIESSQEFSCQPIPYETSRVNCIFAGALKEDIRNPWYAVRVFGIAGQKNVSLYIMTASRTTFFQKALHEAGDSVSLCSARPRNEALKALQDADVLVNIGNAVAFQTPGKIFEYMSMGKPIIHFQKITNDPCLKYFKRYPMVLIIDEREGRVEEHAERIAAFCRRFCGKELDFQEIEKCMQEYTSENSLSKFRRIVNHLVVE